MGEIVDSTLDMGQAVPCADCPEPLEPQEVVVRLESSRGYTSYAIDYQAMGRRMLEVWPIMQEMVPGLLRPLIDGFMFGLRNGIIQRIARAHGIDPNTYMKAKVTDQDGKIHDIDRNSATAQLVTVLMFKHAQDLQRMPDGSTAPIDIQQADIMDAYEGVVRRVPSYDPLPSIEPPTGVEPTGE